MRENLSAREAAAWLEKNAEECVVYLDESDGTRGVTIGGHVPTGKVFVVVHRGEKMLVEAFATAVPDLEPWERRRGIAWADAERAFAAAERMKVRLGTRNP